MKTRTITQAQKPHNPNALHDALIASGAIPLRVESSDTESRFVFDDAISDDSVNAVIAAYAFTPKAPPVDVKVAAQNFRNAINSAATVPQLKNALTNELGILLKEILRAQVADL